MVITDDRTVITLRSDGVMAGGGVWWEVGVCMVLVMVAGGGEPC